jgi:membrane-associated protease RseP (regulator of RpoE activity)
MLDSPPVWMWVIGFLLVLGPLVTLHEFGHYLVARLCGVKSEVFSVGFGREVFGRTDRHGTRWRLSALPLGGYVQFAGDMNPASQPSPEWLALPEEERKATFQAQPLWQRALIVLAGPVMNFLVAIAILAAFNLAYGKLGMFSTSGELVAVGPVEAVSLGVQQTAGITVMMVKGIGQIITGRRSVTELGGPVKIAKFSGEQLSLGWQAFASFVALVSINLAFINLLPIPGLDGGHLAFYAAEAVRRRPASPRSQEWAFRTGMALVLALMLFVTINDLASLSIFGG